MGTKAIQLQLNNNRNNIVAFGQPVIFNYTIYTNNTIPYDSDTGTITLTDSGIYYIDWWLTAVSALTTEYVKFAINVIGEGSTNITGNSINKLGQINGNGIVEVKDTPIQIQLINTTSRNDMPVNVTLVNKEQVQANLIIMNNFVEPKGFNAYNIWDYTTVENNSGSVTTIGPSKLSPERVTTVTADNENIYIGETGMYEINMIVLLFICEIAADPYIVAKLSVNSTSSYVLECRGYIRTNSISASALVELNEGDVIIPYVGTSQVITDPRVYNYLGQISLIKITD